MGSDPNWNQYTFVADLWVANNQSPQTEECVNTDKQNLSKKLKYIDSERTMATIILQKIATNNLHTIYYWLLYVYFSSCKQKSSYVL